IIALTHDDPSGTGLGLVFSVAPWFFVTRLLRNIAERTLELQCTVDELRESRAAHAGAPGTEERSRAALEMHDVPAHSLSALALQLEGTRLLARDRDADDDVVSGLERAHHLAATGLAE